MMPALVLAVTLIAGEYAIPNAQGSRVDPSGRTIEVTSKCLRLDGKPLVPVMGEMHYSRIPENEWGDVLRTMKRGGISIVSTYVFWNHHEWTCGTYDFSGNRDLSRFLAEVKDLAGTVPINVHSPREVISSNSSIEPPNHTLYE